MTVRGRLRQIHPARDVHTMFLNSGHPCLLRRRLFVVCERHPDKTEEVLEAMTTLIRQSLGPWIHLQTAVVESARARLHNTVNPQLSFVTVDGKSAEIKDIIAVLVQWVFDFQVHICVHVHAWAVVSLAVV